MKKRFKWPTPGVMQQLKYVEKHPGEIKPITKEELDKFIMSLKPIRPYIEPLEGGVYYRINGNNDFFYITDKAGAIEADRLLRLKAEEYCKI